MTKEQKFEIALFYFKKHGSLVNYGRLFNNVGQLKPNVTLHDIEECIKSDPYIGAGTGCPCDTCIHCQNMTFVHCIIKIKAVRTIISGISNMYTGVML